MHRRWLALAVLITFGVPRTFAQPGEEGAIHDLAQRFFTAYAGRDPSAIPSAVSTRSPHRANLVALGRTPAGAAQTTVDARIKVGRIRVDGDRATAHVLVEILPSGAASATAAERLLLCAREEGRWQVWGVAPSLAELVENAAGAPSRDARIALLGPDSAWLAAELWPALVARGDRLFQRARYPDAAKAYEAGVDIAEAAGERGGVAVAVRGIGHVRLYAGDLDAALAAYEQSLGIARANALHREVFRALNGVGNVRAALKQPEAALRAFAESLRLAEASDDQAGIALVLNNIANVEAARGHYDAALERYQRALAIKEQVGDAAAISIGAYNIGRVLFLQRKYQDALAYQQRSLALAQQLDRRAGVASIHHSLGEIHDRLQDHARAMHHYRSSLDVAAQIGDRGTAVDDLLSIGRVWRVRGEAGLAIESVQRAIKMLDPKGRSQRHARAFRQLGLAFQAQGSLTDARQALETSQQMFVDLGDRAALADTLRELAAVSIHASRLDDAQGQLDASLAAARALDDGRRIVAALTALAGLHGARGQYALALTSVRDGLALAARSQDADGASALEQAGARAYAALGRYDEARQAYDRAIESFEQPRQADAAAPLGDDVSAAGAPHTGAAELMLARQRFADAWNYIDRGRASELRRQFPGSGAAASGSISRSADAAAIGYLVSDRQVHLFFFPARRERQLGPARHVTANIDRDALAAAIARHHAALHRREASPASKELYRLLIEPFGRELQATRSLRIVPDGVLWNLPFESLQRADGGFLIQTHTVSYSVFATPAKLAGGGFHTAPSPSVLAVGRDDAVPESHGWLMSLEPAGQVPAIPGVAQAQQVSAVYQQSRRLTLSAGDATEAAVTNAAREPAVLHFSALARLDDFDPLHSGLLLAPALGTDGLLTASEIAMLRIRANAVVLAALWRTPRAGTAGRALRAQSWAWRLAGSPNVIVSRWPPGEAGLEDALQGLHRALARATGVRDAHDRAAAALRDVQLAWLARHPAGAPRWTGIALITVD